MASDAAFTAIRTWLDANWTATPIRWENETFDIPAITEYPAAPAAWVAVEMSGEGYHQRSFGSGAIENERWVEAGSLLIYSLQQAGSGSLVARANATAIALSLRGLALAGAIQFTGMSIGDGGPGDEDGNWWQLVLRAEWTRG